MLHNERRSKLTQAPGDAIQRALRLLGLSRHFGAKRRQLSLVRAALLRQLTLHVLTHLTQGLGGARLDRTLDMVRRFRAGDDETPIILMGYYNPIYIYGVDRFLADAMDAGVDGLIVVDLPPEEDVELCLPARDAGMHFIRLATPTTDDARLPKVIANTSGFVYYVAIAGITGTKSAATADIDAAVARLKRHTDLPVAVGFGIKTPEQAAAVAEIADAAVVGSAIVQTVADNLADDGTAGPDLVSNVLAFTRSLADGVRRAVRRAAE